MTTTGSYVIGFIVVGLGLIVLSRLIQTVDRVPFSTVRRLLEVQVGVPLLSGADPASLYYHPYPGRLTVNWTALVLGPVYYVLVGLWVHASIMAILVVVSGGLLAPVIWLYCGLKANEDVLEFRVAGKSVY
jgi:hypothetical protein